MATFNVTLTVRSKTVPGTPIQRGEIPHVSRYQPNSSSGHPRLWVFHITNIPSKYNTVEIATEKFKLMVEASSRDSNDLSEIVRLRQFRIRIGMMTAAELLELDTNNDIHMVWGRFSALLGKRIVNVKDNPLLDDYTMITDGDL